MPPEPEKTTLRAQSGVTIRRAEPHESQTLTTIARQAKAYWDYPQDWLQHWRGELSISPEYIARHWVYAAVREHRVAGFYALMGRLEYASLEHLWVKPELIGTGLGRALFEHACQLAVSHNFPAIEVVADPNAEGFYRRMGAVKYKELHYQLFDTERVLPVLRKDLHSDSG